MKKFIIMVLISSIFVGCGNNSNYSDDNYKTNDYTESNINIDDIDIVDADVDIIIDSKQFSLISSDELIKLMGQPSYIEYWNYTTSKGTFPTKTYNYNTDYYYEFLVINDMVVRMNCYSLKYWNGNGEDIKYLSKDNIPLMFGIDEKVDSPLYTGYAVRWSNLTGSVKDVWAIDVDDTNKTMSGVKITYDELYLD